jgi:hypothetical protein
VPDSMSGAAISASDATCLVQVPIPFPIEDKLDGLAQIGLLLSSIGKACDALRAPARHAGDGDYMFQMIQPCKPSCISDITIG